MNIVVVTGASSGIGREIAKILDKKEKFDEIWVLARRADRLEELRSVIGAKIVPLSLDLSATDDLKVYAERLESEKPNVKILANCAGFGKFDHYENIPLETHLNMVDLNCKAVMAMVNYTLPYMENGAKILNIASCAGFQPIPYINVYAATKSFVISYSRALAEELKYRGITVTAVCPYWTKTEFFDRAVKKDEKPVVIKYDVLYDPEKVAEKAVLDLYKGKQMSVYGKLNNFQRFLVKILPHKTVMKVWLKSQKLSGAKEIR